MCRIARIKPRLSARKVRWRCGKAVGPSVVCILPATTGAIICTVAATDSSRWCVPVATRNFIWTEILFIEATGQTSHLTCAATRDVCRKLKSLAAKLNRAVSAPSPHPTDIRHVWTVCCLDAVRTTYFCVGSAACITAGARSDGSKHSAGGAFAERAVNSATEMVTPKWRAIILRSNLWGQKMSQKHCCCDADQNHQRLFEKLHKFTVAH